MVPAWAGSLERFMAEFVHGRGLGILHPNLDGKVSFARRVPWKGLKLKGDVAQDNEEDLRKVEGTSAPALRGEDAEAQETMVLTHKDALKALVRKAGGCRGPCGFTKRYDVSATTYGAPGGLYEGMLPSSCWRALHWSSMHMAWETNPTLPDEPRFFLS